MSDLPPELNVSMKQLAREGVFTGCPVAVTVDFGSVGLIGQW
jgi:hypothetical protein